MLLLVILVLKWAIQSSYSEFTHQRKRLSLLKYKWENGTVNPASSIMAHEGSGANKERQEKPHAHYAGYTSWWKYVVAWFRDRLKLITYEVKDSTLIEKWIACLWSGKWTKTQLFIQWKIRYVMTELSSEVIALTYKPRKKDPLRITVYSTLPNNLWKIVKAVLSIFFFWRPLCICR